MASFGLWTHKDQVNCKCLHYYIYEFFGLQCHMVLELCKKSIYNMQPICNLLNLAFNFGFIYFPQHCCTNLQQNVVNIFINHVVNPVTSKMNSTHWSNILNISYWNEITRSLKPNGVRSMRRGLLNMWTKKCTILMQLLL